MFFSTFAYHQNRIQKSHIINELSVQAEIDMPLNVSLRPQLQWTHFSDANLTIKPNGMPMVQTSYAIRKIICSYSALHSNKTFLSQFVLHSQSHTHTDTQTHKNQSKISTVLAAKKVHAFSDAMLTLCKKKGTSPHNTLFILT